jgi:hypothetical protein
MDGCATVEFVSRCSWWWVCGRLGGCVGGWVGGRLSGWVGDGHDSYLVHIFTTVAHLQVAMKRRRRDAVLNKRQRDKRSG